MYYLDSNDQMRKFDSVIIGVLINGCLIKCQ